MYSLDSVSCVEGNQHNTDANLLWSQQLEEPQFTQQNLTQQQPQELKKDVQTQVMQQNPQAHYAEAVILEADFSEVHPPRLVAVATEEFPQNPSMGTNFLKGVKWAPDGSCLMTCSDDNRVHIFELHGGNLQLSGSLDTAVDVGKLQSMLVIREAESIYGYKWYPLMNSLDAVSCCFVTATRDQPVHMWDAFTGLQRASYCSYDQMDEIMSPYSLTFDVSGNKLLCGYDGQIQMFDTNRPGRESSLLSNWVKKSLQGIQGIVSCFATSITCPNLIACGSYAKCCSLIDLTGSKHSSTVGSFCDPSGKMAGVTHVQYSRDGWQLFAGARKSHEILCWDLRSMSNEPLYRFVRGTESTTNQRLEFDLDPSGKSLVSGSQDGQIFVFSLDDYKNGALNPNCRTPFPQHKDSVNGVSFHPSLPFIATSTGQRKFEVESDSSPLTSKRQKRYENGLNHDNMVAVWHYSTSST